MNNTDIDELFKGPIEFEDSLFAEEKQLRPCYKEEHHKDFIPVSDFSVNSLPPDYRDMDLFNLITHQISLTVSISIEFTSTRRPEFYPGTTDQYPALNFRGQSKLRTGSGFVCRVVKQEESPCQCVDCKTIESPKREWGEINVFTTSHVVFDESETKHTSCRFFYDNVDSEKRIIRAERIVRCNLEKDWCRLNLITHDIDLLDKLEHHLEQFDQYCQTVEDKYSPIGEMHKLTVIVSHSHGNPKMVSIGEWQHKRRKGKYGDHVYTYTTPTCPGSSGAYVYIMGGGKQSYDYLHKGCVKGSDLKLNYSTRGWETL
ncbi:uncharacterized protein LOC131943360 [Physella acuta]|uniref:uncharacterized protein LOC131943360 n=1 Tax=Physella acuta TaxID=109671 RepID=UPI0027DD6D44|nr:uncharacterized protein LOC131943360 [Physella acuta]XP_059159427.1 uncharacterized protein LOC131943360 [Physella acuta]